MFRLCTLTLLALSTSAAWASPQYNYERPTSRPSGGSSGYSYQKPSSYGNVQSSGAGGHFFPPIATIRPLPAVPSLPPLPTPRPQTTVHQQALYQSHPQTTGPPQRGTYNPPNAPPSSSVGRIVQQYRPPSGGRAPPSVQTSPPTGLRSYAPTGSVAFNPQAPSSGNGGQRQYGPTGTVGFNPQAPPSGNGGLRQYGPSGSVGFNPQAPPSGNGGLRQYGPTGSVGFNSQAPPSGNGGLRQYGPTGTAGFNPQAPPTGNSGVIFGSFGPSSGNSGVSGPNAPPAAQPLRIPFGKTAVIQYPLPGGPGQTGPGLTGPAVPQLQQQNFSNGGRARPLKQYAVIEIIDNDIMQNTDPFLPPLERDDFRAHFGATGTGATPPSGGPMQIDSRANFNVLEQQRSAGNDSNIALGSGGLGLVRLSNGNIHLGSGSLGYVSGQMVRDNANEARTRSETANAGALHFGHGSLAESPIPGSAGLNTGGSGATSGSGGSTTTFPQSGTSGSGSANGSGGSGSTTTFPQSGVRF